ncbi:MAG: CcmD family protein [Clostridiales bacterium]|nr:CcmD family protein [Clostridiales bacterium]
MDPMNLELYRLVLADAPFVIGAYAILWMALVAYVSMVFMRLMRLEKEVTVLEESLERRSDG